MEPFRLGDMTTLASTRQRILRVSRRLGMEPQLRAVQRTFESAERRRTRHDDDRVRLLCAYVLSRESSCIDVGANVGGILQHFVRLAPAGRHMAFEPIPELAADLRRRFPAVDVRETALGATAEAAREFVRVLDAPSRSGFAPAAVGSHQTRRMTVAVDALDAILPPDFVPTIVKIDVEGAELEVLRGALMTLKAHRPIVLFEHQPSVMSPTGAVYDLLANEGGLSIFDMDGHGPYPKEVFAGVVSAGTRWNFVARPYR
jgi:FkbM family methyltransferase